MSENERKPAMSRGEFYRQCRIWHGYLSAFAFLALLFFSLTGISLNHPGWLKRPPQAVVETTVRLTPAELAQVSGDGAGAALARIVGQRVKLRGEYKDAEVAGPSVFVRMQGVGGNSDLQADLTSGEVRVAVEPADTLEVLDALHRGETAGAAWRLLIDIAGVVLIAMSLIGYVLFLSLRMRLATALVLTVLSAAGAIGVFLMLVT